MWSRLSADHHHRRCPLDWKKQANSERPRALIKSNPHYALPLPPISPINSPSNEHGKDSRIYSVNVSESCTAVTPKASWRTPFPQRIINVCRRYQRSSVSQTQVARRAVYTLSLMKAATGKSFHICFLLCTFHLQRLRKFKHSQF